MKNDQTGITLVEVIATLALSSIIVVIIWTAIISSVKYNNTENDKMKVQQEANYIIEKIQIEHRTRSCYYLIIEEKKIIISDCDNDNPTDLVISEGYKYSPSTKSKVVPNEKDLKLQGVMIEEPKNEKIYYKIDTIITRYKTN